jgi:superfamily II DNA/RNA helicase
MTQTVIFINTKKFAETVHKILRKEGYKSSIIFSDMTNEERDEYVEKFRKQEVNVVLTTNLLARGIDVPEVELVINFDIPKIKDFSTGKFYADPENYLHRIGRAGRFGVKGVAVSLFDNEEDEAFFWEIIETYKTKPKISKLEKPKDLKEILEGLGSTKGV